MRTIDFYNAAKGTNRDADMARILGITTATIAQAKKSNHFSAYIAARCAELAGLDVQEAITAAAIEAEHQPEKREYMLSVLDAMKNRRNEKRAVITDSPQGETLVGRVGIEPTTNGLRVRCSTS
jgi:hypothetical protein